ncbi:MAG: ATP-binding cassette domain-containing protein [Bdellovibrionales bacterium]|nr:ATP-binding cassette domain-containing protein [Bdellovibrionales bacterium]
MIECKDLSFQYFQGQHQVLHKFNFVFQDHQNYMIEGAHGSGKSTLLKLLSSEKFHYIDGKVQGDVLHFLAQNQIFYFHSEESNYFVYDLVFDEFYYTLRCLGYPLANIENQTRLILSYFQIEHWIYRSVSNMSRGERQYLKLILGISTKQYRLMCLDEPLLHLDPTHQVFILQYLEQIQRMHGTYFIVVDHENALWKSYFHFQNLALTSIIDYQPWFILDNPSIEPFEPLYISYKQAPLARIQNHSLDLIGGQNILLLGANGTGKTTLCKFMMGMLPTSIQIPISKNMLLDDAPSMFLYKNLQKEWKDSNLKHPYPNIQANTLSVGQNKIEMFQRLLAKNPQLLILDEIYEGLDPTYINFVRENLAMYMASGGCVIQTSTQVREGEAYDQVLEL